MRERERERESRLNLRLRGRTSQLQRLEELSKKQTHRQTNGRTDGQPVMAAGAPDPDADFVYDYHALRVGGLVFAGVIVFLSILLLAGNSLCRCARSQPQTAEEADST
ncbi:hypothetical protein AGOR_G00031640 [Albula goreensis]|uniref:FXYD domain-containing ion transport regulator n=1 Tax=Albula goreensis TaxID=1534307 RepID=A0A8T3E862_9TELE|nr:hypothetical protein AGOR_G00031640 [Albula goreensis]